jgi:cephalosporin-C deacetylase-like acetyl esterase
VLRIGTIGLAAMLAQGCDGGSGGVPAPSAPRLDPSTYTPPTIPFDSLVRLFTYEANSALNLTVANKYTSDGVVVEDVTYSDTRGRMISAYLLSPADAAGRLAGIVCSPGNGLSRGVWLTEASDLVKRGAVALITQIPLTANGDPNADSAAVIDGVIAQRRGLDLLAGQPEVDPGRLAFVGHSWAAIHGTILAGVEPRLAAVITVAIGARFSRSWATALVGNAGEGRIKAYLDALTRFDGARYVAVAGRRALLMQFGKRDQLIPPDQADELTSAAVGTKQRKDYDAAHDLIPVPEAISDRLAFLRPVLRLT